MINRGEAFRRPRYSVALSGLAVCCGFSATVKAGDFAFGLGYAMESSDNILRETEGNEREDVAQYLVAGAAYEERGPTLLAHANVQFQKNTYRDGQADDQKMNFVDASAVWTISPERFTLTAEDHLAQVQRDSRQPNVPGNWVAVNEFAFGPDFYLHFSSRNTLALGSRYGEIYMDSDVGDNRRLTHYSRWLYETGALTTVSLNYEITRVEFKDNTGTLTNIDFTRSDEFVRFDLHPALSHYQFDFGRTKIDREDGEVTDGNLARATWTRQLTAISNFSLSASREFHDVGIALASNDPDVGNGAGSDVYYVKQIQSTYAHGGADWTINLQLLGTSYDYETEATQDRNERGGHFDISQNPGGLFTTMLYADFMRTNYITPNVNPPLPNTDLENNDSTVGLRLRYRLSRYLSIGVEGSRARRKSEIPVGSTAVDTSYIENRVLVGLYYSSGPLYTPARR